MAGTRTTSGGSNTGVKLTVSLYTNGASHSNLFEGRIGIPNRTPFPTNHPGARAGEVVRHGSLGAQRMLRRWKRRLVVDKPVVAMVHAFQNRRGVFENAPAVGAGRGVTGHRSSWA